MKIATALVAIVLCCACSKGPAQGLASGTLMPSAEKQRLVVELLSAHISERPNLKGKEVYIAWGEELDQDSVPGLKSLGFSAILTAPPKNMNGKLSVESDWIVQEETILIQVIENRAMITVWSYLLDSTAPGLNVVSVSSESSLCSPGFEELGSEEYE